jgi:hypothetical protein
MSNRDNYDQKNDRDEIYGKGKESRKKKNKFRDHGHNKVRDFKRNYSQEQDREDMNYHSRYR